MAQFPIVTTDTVPGKPPGFYVQNVVASSTKIHHIGQGLNYLQGAYVECVNGLIELAEGLGADAIVGLRISTSRHPSDSASGMKDDTVVLVGTAISSEELSASELAKKVKKAEAEAERQHQVQLESLAAEKDALRRAQHPLRPGKCDCGEIERTEKNTVDMGGGRRLCNTCGIPF